MNKIIPGIFVLFIFYSCGNKNVVISGISVETNRPRLFISEDFQEEIENKIERDSLLRDLHNDVIAVADSFIPLDPLTREMNGRRLLSVSRQGLKRCLYLAYAYQTTGHKKYLKRSEEEMLALASFKDRNPSHFLDVAEMTTGLGIAYDWLYDDLSKNSRKIIKEAIITKGINPSFDPRYNDWLTVENNWNQVCNTGITIGALSIMEDEPELAQKVLNRTIQSIKIASEVYKPNGVYPEGPMYWGYGTSFHVMLYDLFISVFNKDFGIIEDGILQSAYYFLHATAPGGDYFNYSDSSTSRSLSPALYWFTDYMKTPAILSNEYSFLKDYLKSSRINSPHSANQRLLPFSLIWAGSAGEDIVPLNNTFFGKGPVPVVMHRSSWDDPKALYLGIKGGSPSANHGHMDIGSFILELNGVRWFHDPGTENYTQLESAGLDIWKSNQESDRWQVFRYHNKAHNTLTIDGKDQDVKGHAEIDNLKGEVMAASLNLTPLYGKSVEFAERKFKVLKDEQVEITDSIINNSKISTIRWSLLTKATPEIINTSTIVLRQDNEELRLEILSPENSKWQIFMINPQPSEYDSPNPGLKVIGIEQILEPQKTVNIEVLISKNE